MENVFKKSLFHIAKEERMPETHHLTALIEREGEWYVALCPELDIASQGETIEEAKAMLSEAVELFLETALWIVKNVPSF